MSDSKELPANPVKGDTCIATYKFSCGCQKSIRLRWTGRFWEYASDQYCIDHDYSPVGGTRLKVEPDDGRGMTQVTQPPMLKFSETLNAATKQ